MRNSYHCSMRAGGWLTVAVFVLGACPLLVLCGCGAQEPIIQSAPVNYMEDWMALTKAGFSNLDVQSAVAITQRLAESGPEGLNPILDVLGDPAGDPVAKILAVISLTSQINPAMQSRLIEFTQEGKETTTRACSAHLLGLLKTPEAEKRVKELYTDKERRVRVEASLMLIMKGDPEALGQIMPLWNDPAMSARDKTQLILMIPDAHVREHLDLFKTVMGDMSLEADARLRAVTVLGHLGDASVLEMLSAAAEKDTDNDVRELAKSALDAVKARLHSPDSAVSMQVVPDAGGASPSVAVSTPGGEPPAAAPNEGASSSVPQ